MTTSRRVCGAYPSGDLGALFSLDHADIVLALLRALGPDVVFERMQDVAAELLART